MANASAHTEREYFQTLYGVDKSQTSENVLSTFSLQVQGVTSREGKEAATVC